MLQGPKDFLLVSKNYVQSLEKFERKKSILLRRSIVLRHLNDQYKLARNAHLEIIDELRSARITATVSTIRKDAESYRLAYRFYQGERGGVLSNLEDRKNFALKPLRYLIKDGFDSWEKIISAIGTQEEIYPAKEEKGNLTIGDLAEDRLQKSFGQISSLVADLVSVGDSTKNELRKTFHALSKKNGKIDELQKENGLLRKRESELISQMKAQAEVFECKLKESDQLLSLASLEIKSLEKKVLDMELKFGKLKNGKAVKICGLSDEVCRESALQLEGASEVSDLSREKILPAECCSYGKPFLYSESFVKEFDSLEERDKVLVAKTMEVLSTCGSSHRSLRTKIQLFDKGLLKKGDIRSYAGRYFRFTWEINKGEVYMKGLFRKKDLEG